MKNIIINILKFLLWLIIVFIGFVYIIDTFLYPLVILLFPLFLLFIFSIFLWLIFFKKKIQLYIGIFIVFVIYFYIYFLLPSDYCGGSTNLKFPPSTECRCLGVKKIGKREKFNIELRCVGKVIGWENKVK